MQENWKFETNSLDCVYISIDDVGVKHPKISRSKRNKDSKYIEKLLVVHIQL